MHTHMRARAHTHTHTHLHKHAHAQVHMHKCTYIHTCAHTHTHAHIRTHTHTHAHTHILMHTHTQIHPHTHSYAHLFTCTYRRHKRAALPQAHSISAVRQSRGHAVSRNGGAQGSGRRLRATSRGYACPRDQGRGYHPPKHNRPTAGTRCTLCRGFAYASCADIHPCAHTHTCADTHMCAHIHTHVSTYTHTCTYTHTHMSRHVQMKHTQLSRTIHIHEPSCRRAHFFPPVTKHLKSQTSRLFGWRAAAVGALVTARHQQICVCIESRKSSRSGGGVCVRARSLCDNAVLVW